MNILAKEPLGQKREKQRHTPLERRYNKWLHENGSCVVTGYPEFQIAHTGDQRHGKGTSEKAWLQTSLPLRWQLHHFEEGRQQIFWPTVGLPDYLEIAKDLFDCFEEGGNPGWILIQAQSRVDEEYVRTLFGEIGF